MSHDLSPAFDDQEHDAFGRRFAEIQQRNTTRREENRAKLDAMPWNDHLVTSVSNCPYHQYLTDVPEIACHGGCANDGEYTCQQSTFPLSKHRYAVAQCRENRPERERLAKLNRYRRDSGLVDGNKRNSEYQHTFDAWKVTTANQELYSFLRFWSPHADEGVYIASLPSPSNPSGNGLGKSYALHALTNRLCAEGVTCRFCRTSDFLIAIRDTYHSDTEVDELDIVRQFSQVPVLLWDDLGKEAIRSEWGAEKLYQVIDDRCRQGLPVVISSNFLPDMIQDRFGANFGPAIVSRIAAMCPNIFQLAGDDQRFM